MGLGYPTSVEVMPDLDFRKEFDGKSPKKDGTTCRYEFPARGGKPPVTVYWYEGGRLPKLPESMRGPEKADGLLEGGVLRIAGARVA